MTTKQAPTGPARLLDPGFAKLMNPGQRALSGLPR
jgi:hypothetical protein